MRVREELTALEKHFSEPRKYAQMIQFEGQLGIETTDGGRFQISKALYEELQKDPVHTQITTNEFLEKKIPKNITQKGTEALYLQIARSNEIQEKTLEVLTQLVGILAKK